MFALASRGNGVRSRGRCRSCGSHRRSGSHGRRLDLGRAKMGDGRRERASRIVAGWDAGKYRASAPTCELLLKAFTSLTAFGLSRVFSWDEDHCSATIGYCEN